MKPDKGLSEQTYSFMFMHQFLQKLSSIKIPMFGLPWFPSTREEGKVGYDVRLYANGLPIFIQFKLSDYIIGKNAKEARTGCIIPPYYRFYLRPRNLSSQHSLLYLLDGYSPWTLVYYVAPFFCSWPDFIAVANDERVPEESFFCSPQSVGPINDDEEHLVAFNRGKKTVRLSEPKILGDIVDYEDLIGRLRGRDELPVDSRLNILDFRAWFISLLREHHYFPRFTWPPYRRNYAEARPERFEDFDLFYQINPFLSISVLSYAFLDSFFLWLPID